MHPTERIRDAHTTSKHTTSKHSRRQERISPQHRHTDTQTQPLHTPQDTCLLRRAPRRRQRRQRRQSRQSRQSRQIRQRRQGNNYLKLLSPRRPSKARDRQEFAFPEFVLEPALARPGKPESRVWRPDTVNQLANLLIIRSCNRPAASPFSPFLPSRGCNGAETSRTAEDSRGQQRQQRTTRDNTGRGG